MFFPKSLLRIVLIFGTVPSLFSSDDLSRDRFNEFKEGFKEQSKDMPLIDRWGMLSSVERALFDGLEIEDDNYTPTQLKLFIYNVMREGLKLPHAGSTEEIDVYWLYSFTNTFLDLFIKKNYGYKEATLQEQQMTVEAARSIKLNRDVVALYAHEAFSARTRSFALPDFHLRSYVIYEAQLNRDLTTFHLYHELAHIAHNDTVTSALIDDGKFTYSGALNKQVYQATLNNIRPYLEMGIRLLPFLERTVIGSHLADLVDLLKVSEASQRDNMFWVPPQEAHEYSKMAYFRSEEHSADLFACEHLLRVGKVGAILSFVDQMTFSEFRE